ncbi:MAG: TonB-dependent receptor, partial [Wenzhouxiangellaceae bacterium]
SSDERFEWTLLFNSFGERISRAGALGQPDIFEQPFEQLDFTAKYRIRERWTLKLGLENLLDSSIEFTQGSETTRTYKPGIKIGLGIDFRL